MDFRNPVRCVCCLLVLGSVFFPHQNHEFLGPLRDYAQYFVGVQAVWSPLFLDVPSGDGKFLSATGLAIEEVVPGLISMSWFHLGSAKTI